VLGYPSPMSAAERLPAPLTSIEPPAADHVPVALPALCPYLATLDGGWRSATAIREHNCTAVSPPVPLALEKQRRLCLVAAHTGCSTYGAAEATRAPGRAAIASSRPIARMTPVILDHGRFELRMPALRTDRTAGQAVLVAVLGIALTAILISRPSAGAGATSDPGSASPAASPAASTDVAAASSATTTPAPSEAAPTNPPTAAPSPPASATSGPTATPRASIAPVTSGATYKVKGGDTLSAIAARFNTSVRVLVDLNGITDPSRLRVGQVLKLP
jgi:LysM repeat protein